MKEKTIADVFSHTIDELLSGGGSQDMFHHRRAGEPMPSWRVLSEAVDIVRAIVFPGYFSDSVQEHHTLAYKTGMNIDRLYKILCEQICAGLCYSNNCDSPATAASAARSMALSFIEYLPTLRAALAKDVEATYNGKKIIKTIRLFKDTTGYDNRLVDFRSVLAFLFLDGFCY